MYYVEVQLHGYGVVVFPHRFGTGNTPNFHSSVGTIVEYTLLLCTHVQCT